MLCKILENNKFIKTGIKVGLPAIESAFPEITPYVQDAQNANKIFKSANSTIKTFKKDIKDIKQQLYKPTGNNVKV